MTEMSLHEAIHTQGQDEHKDATEPLGHEGLNVRKLLHRITLGVNQNEVYACPRPLSFTLHVGIEFVQDLGFVRNRDAHSWVQGGVTPAAAAPEFYQSWTQPGEAIKEVTSILPADSTLLL